MGKKVVIIGGGVAGLQTALTLKTLGATPIIIEQCRELGGKVASWHLLFPSFTPASDVVGPMVKEVQQSGIGVRLGCKVVAVEPKRVILASGERIACDAVVVCSGATLFDAAIKEEYGYGIYDNVFTSADIERMMKCGDVKTSTGEEPERIAILHCVGSRDEKVCQRHCSKVCCITGVKQAIELKKRFSKAEIFNFYMDMRMFGPGYEELYHRAQIEYNIHFIRGRISEASPLLNSKVQIKAEDTLTGRPLRMSVDMLVLMVGMRANDDNAFIASTSGLEVADSGFFRPRDMFTNSVLSSVDGIFTAGTITAPKTIGEAITEGTVAAHRVIDYLTNGF